MALSVEGDLQIDKVLMWKVQVPFDNQVRQSPHFSLIGSEWCLRFSHKGTAPSDVWNWSTGMYKTVYHVITLNRVIDGQVAIATEASDQQPPKEQFSLKTFVMQPTYGRTEEKGVTYTAVQTNTTRIWFAGDQNNDIFKTFPSLYDCCEVTVVCQFYGRPLTTFQLHIGTGSLSSVNLFQSDKSVQVSSEVPQDFQTLSADLSNLLEEGILPDVKLECGDQSVQAHRSLLSARSGVFRAMFENKMLESQTGVVKVQDKEFAVLQKLLKFLYSGKLEEPSETDIAALYRAADKYDVASLKKACSYYIVRSLTAENCVGYLQVASSHSDPDLKAAVMLFITKNPCVMKTSDWLSFSEIFPLLAKEILQTYVSSTVQ